VKGNDTRSLGQREFNERCVAVGSLVTCQARRHSMQRLPLPQRAPHGPLSFATAPLSRRSARALRDKRWGGLF
jgi:hypothetical protein